MAAFIYLGGDRNRNQNRGLGPVELGRKVDDVGVIGIVIAWKSKTTETRG